MSICTNGPACSCSGVARASASCLLPGVPTRPLPSGEQGGNRSTPLSFEIMCCPMKARPLCARCGLGSGLEWKEA
eukprot:1853146-Rhodomonas_salina.1